MKFWIVALMCGMAGSGFAQMINPSQYCGVGTVWSEASQTCVGQPAAIDAFDGNADGCVTVGDLLGLLAVFGECAPEGKTIYWFQDVSEGWPFVTPASWMDESTEFYIQDCSIENGYFLTSDLDVTIDFILNAPDSIPWCEDNILYAVLRVDSLEHVQSISQNDIPNFTITYEPINTTLSYLMIPQDFEENDLLMQQPFFQASVFGLATNFIFNERREVMIHGEPYWFYGRSSYGGFNVICGY